MFSIKDGRGAFYQWDTGREITCPDGADQIHFGNTAYGRAMDVDVVDGTARVPDVLLQSDKPLHVWAWVGNPENGYTKESEVFRVERRNKPADYVYTPEEQQNLRDAVNEAVAAKEEAAAAASSAALSAGSAQSDAQSADASQKAAQRYLEATEQKYQNTAEVSAIAVQAREAAVKSAADSEAFSGNAQTAAADAEKAKAEAQKALEETKENAKGYVKTVNGQGPDANGNVQIETGGGGGSDPDAVKYTPQSLTEAQKAQARKNIGVVGTGKDGEDYVLTQADKEEIAGMAAELVDVPEGGGAQADWNAAEGEPGHVLNRTHWVENGRTEVLSELVFTSYSGNGTSLKEPIGLTDGKTYIVNWNGVEYKCKAFTIQLAFETGVNLTATGIGDYYSINDNTEPVTGEPFYVFEYNQPELIEAFGKAVYIGVRDETIHDCTVSIYEETEIIHKLDGKYLPNGIPYLEGGGEPVELLPPTKLEEENGAFIVPADAGIVLVDGGKYVVNWNGTEYTCTAQYFEMNGESGIVMGNIGLALGDGEDTGEPFVILHSEMLAVMGASLNVISLAGDTEVTLGLTGSPPEIIHKLDPKLLPDGVPYVEDGGTVEIVAEHSPTYNEDEQAFFIETASMVSVGWSYIVKWNGVEYTCVAQDLSVMETGAVGLGDMSSFKEYDSSLTGNGEPFGIIGLPGMGMMAYSLEGLTEVTLGIYKEIVTVRKLDNRCLDLAWLPTAEKVDTEVMAETTFTASDSKNTPLNRSILPVGTNVAVIFDGVRYECTVVEVPTIGWITFGNLAILNAEEFPNTGEPFCFTNLLEAGPYAIDFADENDHTVSVYVTESTINKMPAEFLPDSVATKEYVNEMLGVIENGTY